MQRNPLSYPGNKNKLLREIMPEFKSSAVFVDVFCGSGVVGVNSSSLQVVLNDINPWCLKIIQTLYTTSFSDLIAKIEYIIAKYSLTYSRIHEKGFYVEHRHEGLSLYNKEGFGLLKQSFNETHDITELIVLCIYGFNHYLRFNKTNEFNVPVGKVDLSQSIYEDLEGFMALLQSKHVSFSNKDFRDPSLYLEQNAMYYFDPPYLITTAPYNTDWDQDKEIALFSLLDQLHSDGKFFALSNVFLSNGKTNDLLIEWAKKYNTVYLRRQYRNANYQKVNTTDTIEVLVKNY